MLNKFLCSMLAVIFVIILLSIALLLFGPDLSTTLKWLGYESLLLLRQPEAVNDVSDKFLIAQMLTSGALVTLDQFLVLNQSFYQTIITFLIFLNGLFAFVSFTFIRATASEKVNKEISDKLKEIDKDIEIKLNIYIKTQNFSHLVKNSSVSQLSYFNDQISKHEEAIISANESITMIENNVSKLDLADEIEYLKQEIHLLKNK